LCPSLTVTGRTTSLAGVPPNCQPMSTLPGCGFKSEIVLMHACVWVGRSQRWNNMAAHIMSKEPWLSWSESLWLGFRMSKSTSSA
jgi:hypothetical protein